MTAALVAWVLEHSPYEGGARIVHLVLAHHADARRVLSRAQADLATDARMDTGHVRRLMRQMLDDGLIEVIEPKSGRTAAVLRLSVSPRAVERATARALAEPRERDAPLLELEQLQTPLPPAPKRTRKPKQPGRYDATAEAIVKAVWEGKNPRPAQRYFQLKRIAEQLLEAGHEQSQVELAFFAVPTITVRSCEFWLNGGTKRAPRQSGKVGIDRDTPGGRIKL